MDHKHGNRLKKLSTKLLLGFSRKFLPKEPFAKLRPNSSTGTASLYEDWILVSTLHDSFGFAAEFRPDSMKNPFKPSNNPSSG